MSNISNKNKVTAVIPAYNEEKTIKNVIRVVRPYVDEILVVLSRKSDDRTEEILKSMGIRYIIDHGIGKGDALREGIKRVSTGITLFIDADGSHEPKDIPKLVDPIIKGTSDMVVGSRATGGSDELHGTLYMYLKNAATELIMLIINYRWGVCLSECENGFRAVRTKAVQGLNLKAKYFDIEQEMVMKALKKNIRVINVPSHEYERRGGQSKLSILKSGWRFFWRLLIDIW